jgi:hypothetical protein
MGNTTPIINPETVNAQSLFENLKTDCTIADNSNTTETATICAASMPVANAIKGPIFELAVPPRMVLK